MTRHPTSVADGAFYHFSVDDVLPGLVDASRGPDLLTHPLLSFLGSLYADFGTKTDLYLFAEAQNHGVRSSLADVSARQRRGFEALPWLRLGPHAHDDQTPPYRQSVRAVQETCDWIFDQIKRFSGSTTRSRWLRLHYFSECFECADYFRDRGIDTLLLTDKAAGAYRLPPAIRKAILERGVADYRGLRWVRSHLRVEALVASGQPIERAIDRVLEQHGFAVLFTHEVALAAAEVREAALTGLRHLERRGVASA
ncbi:MAG: hypothetical protein AAF628_12555 [Planctomycetota bacterium]